MIKEAGERIKQVRELRGFQTQMELAHALNVNNHSVSTWERGKAFPLTTDWIKLARLLAVSLDYLILGDTKALALSNPDLYDKIFAPQQRTKRGPKPGTTRRSKAHGTGDPAAC